MKTLARIALAMVLLAVAACAGPRVRRDAGQAADPALMAAQVARERALAADSAWSLKGRLGVSDGKDAGSGSLDWSQDGDAFRFRVHAPVTGKTWELAGDRDHAVLHGLHAMPVDARDAATLLARELGWQVPVAQLSAWARGMLAPGPATIRFGERGLPALIEQDGWRVEYLAYDLSLDPPLPMRVFARRGVCKVRLAIREWNTE